MPHYPIDFCVSLERSDGGPGEATAGHRPRLLVGAPPDFGGSDAWWSPEHLLVAALASCMAETYVAMAAHANIHVGRFRCGAQGTLGRAEGKVAFLSMLLVVRIVVLADDVARARDLVEKAKSACFVSSALRCPIEVEAEVVAS